jgi:PDZ domain
MTMAKINPKNLTAQFAHRAAGNPPSTLPHTAISNFFPGLEFDLRSLWKHIFVGVELHESGTGTNGHRVLAVASGSPADIAGVRTGDRLRSVDGRDVEAVVVLESGATTRREALEFFNALAEVAQKPGQMAQCVFRASNGTLRPVALEVRPIFEGAAFSRGLLEAGAMTQGLCSPWQADYRECGCYYWAASRPDFINVTFDSAAGPARGHSWMQTNRGPGDAYVEDAPTHTPGTQITYEDLYTRWEQVLKFVVGGKDSE